MDAIAAFDRASRRSAAIVYEQLKRGLPSLKSIATTAPMLGIAGTAWGIVNSFRGAGAAKQAAIAALSYSLSHSLLFTALGLLVAIPAWIFHCYLTARLETLAVEMETARLQMMNILLRPR